MYPFRTLPRRHQAPDANSLQTKSGRCPARTGDLLLVRDFGARNGGAWPVTVGTKYLLSLRSWFPCGDARRQPC
jgi:hypothetical protein